MHRLFSSLFCFCIYFLSNAQMNENTIPTELFTGTRAIALESFWFKPIEKTKWDFFSYVNFESNYKYPEKSSTYFQGLFTYNFNTFFGASGGANVINGKLSPTLAVSLQGEGKNYYWNIFPSIELRSSGNYDIWGIIMSYPTVKNIPLFAQAIAEANFNNKTSNFISENLRLGYNHKNKLQAGIGFNFIQTGVHYKPGYNPGVFIRREF